MNIDAVYFVVGSGLMFCIYLGFLIWGIKTKQFKDNEYLSRKPLEEENE